MNLLLDERVHKCERFGLVFGQFEGAGTQSLALLRHVQVDGGCAQYITHYASHIHIDTDRIDRRREGAYRVWTGVREG